MNTLELLPLIKFRFNIDHPSLEDCYLFGYECAIAEISEEENPYKENTLENQYWSDGWWAGLYEEKPLFQNDTIEDQGVNGSANEGVFHSRGKHLFLTFIKITSIFAVTAILGYQVFDLVA